MRKLSPVLVFLSLFAASACKDGFTDTADPYNWAQSFTLTPPAGAVGTTVRANIQADESVFRFGETSADFGAGIVVNALTVHDGWNAEAEIFIEPDADNGRRDVTITIGDRDEVLYDAFRVTDETFTLTPGRGRLGETVDVELVGNNTRWLAGRTWVNFGDGVDVLEFTVLSETLAEATLSIEGDAAPGLRDVYTEDQGKIVTVYDGFQVDRIGLGATFEPVSGEQGDTIEFTVRARGTTFEDGVTTLAFYDGGGLNPDIRVDSITVLDAQNLWGRMTLSNAAELGMRDVLITTGDEGVRIPDAFEVLGAPLNRNEVAVDLSFYVFRSLNNETGDIAENVVAQCIFYIPLNPPCPSGGGMGSEPQASPYDSNAVGPIIGSGSGGDEDCPNPATLSAGDFVWLESDINTVTLEKVVDGNSGMIYYEGKDLTMEDYVPNNWYDLHLQGDPEGLLEELVTRVLPTVPSDWHMLTPQLWGNYTHDRTTDFTYTWTPAMTYPDAYFVTRIDGTTYAGTEYQGRAVSIPWDDGEHTYTADEMLQLDPNPVSFLAYSYREGPEFGLRDSIYQTNQTVSYIALQATMILE